MECLKLEPCVAFEVKNDGNFSVCIWYITGSPGALIPKNGVKYYTKDIGKVAIYRLFEIIFQCAGPWVNFAGPTSLHLSNKTNILSDLTIFCSPVRQVRRISKSLNLTFTCSKSNESGEWFMCICWWICNQVLKIQSLIVLTTGVHKHLYNFHEHVPILLLSL